MSIQMDTFFLKWAKKYFFTKIYIFISQHNFEDKFDVFSTSEYLIWREYNVREDHISKQDNLQPLQVSVLAY